MRLTAHIPFGTRTRTADSPRGLGSYPRLGWDRFEADNIKPVVDLGITDLLPFLPGGVNPSIMPIGIGYDGAVKYSNMLSDQLVECRKVNAAHADFVAGYFEWCRRHRVAGGTVRPYVGKFTRWQPSSFEYFSSMLGEQALCADEIVFDAANLNEAEWSPAHLSLGWLATMGKRGSVEAGPIRRSCDYLNRAEFGVFANVATFESRLGKPDYLGVNEHRCPITLFVRGPKGLEQGTVTPPELAAECFEVLATYPSPTVRLCVSVGALLADPAVSVKALVSAAR